VYKNLVYIIKSASEAAPQEPAGLAPDKRIEQTPCQSSDVAKTAELRGYCGRRGKIRARKAEKIADRAPTPRGGAQKNKKKVAKQ